MSTLTDSQKKEIRRIGFGSILELKCSVIPYSLIIWLAKQYDESSGSIQILGTHSIKLDGMTVHQILGIPFGGTIISTKSCSEAKAIIAKDTCHGNLALQIDDLMKMINSELQGDKFVRIFMLVVLSVFLCPTSSFRASH